MEVIENLNPLCTKCALCGNECAGMPRKPWTGCIYRTAPVRAYTIRLHGQWYAPMFDEHAHHVYSTDGAKFAKIERTPGSDAGLHAAIIAVCEPLPSWDRAYVAAYATGKFAGELYGD